MKIGIISEYKRITVNFGNTLQTYALNYFLRNAFHAEHVESIMLADKQSRQYTDVFSVSFAKKAIDLVLRKSGVRKDPKQLDRALISERLRRFADFQRQHIPTSAKPMEAKDLAVSDYDLMIVGSDVVWEQGANNVNRVKFLDFSAEKPFRRISFAASFGRDYIPKENVRYVRRYLDKFDAISVREHSSVAMLNSIGISNAAYCLDPTLLLKDTEWSALEEKPSKVDRAERYAFVYLLGSDARQRARIMDFAAKNGFKIVTIPHAKGIYTQEDENFGNIRLNDCSIENWIWLIHHAQYVITDSFHGTVFSTIFEKRFVVLRRTGAVDINNRMQDYLREINQLDKSISEDGLTEIKDFVWDYEQIHAAIQVRRDASIEFLKNAIGEVNA